MSGWLAVFALVAVFGLGMLATLALQTLEAAHKDHRENQWYANLHIGDDE